MRRMSGFAGIVSYSHIPAEAELVARLDARLRYRGQDSNGHFSDDAAFLTQHLKLNLREPAPIQVPIRLGSLVLVSDARFDDRDTLIDRLASAGQPVEKRAADAMLILHAYAAYGAHCVDHLSGDFAFAIWDAQRRLLLAARDQIGRRNFYYASTEHGFAFSSDVRALCEIRGVADELNSQYIADYLMLGEGFFIDPGSTPFRLIRRLERGHLLVFNADGLEKRPYWSFPSDVTPLRYRSEADYVEHFRHVFRAAVKDRLRADSVVLTLSGGMDSSAVTATALELVRSGEANPKLSVVTGVYERIQDVDGAFAKEIARHLEIADQQVLYRIERYFLLRPYLHIGNAIRQNFTPQNWLNFQRILASCGTTALFGYLGDALRTDLPLSAYMRRMNPLAFAQAYRRIASFRGRRPPLGTGLFARLRRSKETVISSSHPFPPWIHSDLVRERQLHERWDVYWSVSAKAGDKDRNPYLRRMFLGYDFYSHDETDSFDFTPVDIVDPYADLRVLRFLAGLPPLPWFYEKFLLRQMMVGRLPVTALQRPKYIAGDLIAHLLSLPENAWIDQWQPSRELEEFVLKDKIPKITGAHAQIDAGQSVHLRPLLLDSWLNENRRLRSS